MGESLTSLSGIDSLYCQVMQGTSTFAKGFELPLVAITESSGSERFHCKNKVFSTLILNTDRNVYCHTSCNW